MIVSWVCSTFVEFDHLDEFSVDDEAPYNAMTPDIQIGIFSWEVNNRFFKWLVFFQAYNVEYLFTYQ